MTFNDFRNIRTGDRQVLRPTIKALLRQRYRLRRSVSADGFPGRSGSKNSRTHTIGERLEVLMKQSRKLCSCLVVPARITPGAPRLQGFRWARLGTP